MGGNPMTPTVADLRIVNTKVNLLPYKSDAERFGTPEFWATIDEQGGDCDDYVIAKYRRLFAMGFSPKTMRFATCFVEPFRGEDGNWVPKSKRYHLVLLVDVDNTTYVLDNRHPLPMEDEILPYEFHKIQVAGTQQWEWANGADRSYA